MHGRRFAWVLGCAVALVACTRPPANLGANRPPGAVESRLDDVVLTVVVEPNPVPAGELPIFRAELRNDRGEEVDLSSGGCAFADLRVSIPTPWEPTGRTWSGREGWFKTYLMEHAYGPGGVAAFSPIDAILISTPCEEATRDVLQPGESLTADFSRAIGNFMTTHSHAATMAFSITVDLDRQNDPPPIEPGYTGIPPRFFPEYRHLSASGEVTIGGPPAAVVSAGEAIDVLLDDSRFTTWLNEQPPATCETANLFLDSGQPIEAGAVWYIDLYCETGVPRHYAFAQVDAATREIRRLEICEPPCE